MGYTELEPKIGGSGSELVTYPTIKVKQRVHESISNSCMQT